MRRTTLAVAVIAVILVALLLGGCQTITTPEGRVDRDKVLSALNSAEMVFSVGLSFAELRGADPVKVEQIQVTASIAFDLVRDAIALNLRDTKPDELGAALLRLRLVVNDALALCDAVGVNPVVVAEVRSQVDRAFVVLEAIANGLEG
jgi:hypothetical protein